jgi:glutathione-regulated potassium-efflux system ancillary protein KefF
MVAAAVCAQPLSETTAPTAVMKNDILVLAAHPDLAQSRVNRALLHAAQERGVAVRDLYTLYPDYSIDLPAEQAALAAARLVVWLHPIHWYGMPALMKLWIDEVFAFGWAYGPGGRALYGKDLWLVTSTGGPQDSYRPDRYNRYFFDAFLPPYDQTATLVGMRFLPPLVLHGAHRASDDALRAHVQVFGDRLASYPAWPELAELEEAVECDVPSDARPPTQEEV